MNQRLKVFVVVRLHVRSHPISFLPALRHTKRATVWLLEPVVKLSADLPIRRIPKYLDDEITSCHVGIESVGGKFRLVLKIEVGDVFSKAVARVFVHHERIRLGRNREMDA